MNQIVTEGIVLTRIDYGEADRIITLLTPDQGKIRVMAKGVRKLKSKLAGGIELFSVSSVTFIPGRKDIGTLVSSRLKVHYGKIVSDLPRTMLGYELLKRINRATEDATGPEYFELLVKSLEALDQGLHTLIIELWFDGQLLKLAGHQPNLATENNGAKLTADKHYVFDYEAMAFTPHEQGSITADHIKFLRLVFGVQQPVQLQQVKDAGAILTPCQQLLSTVRKQFIRI